jgi:hypothetical protein
MALSHGVKGGRRACVLTVLSQGAVEGGGEPRGESAPVVSVLTSTQGHRVTTAALGVGIVVVACLSRLAPSRAGAHGAVARRRAAKAHWPSRPALATLWHPEVGDDEGLILSVTRLRGLASGYTPSDTLPATYMYKYKIQPWIHARDIKIHQDTYPITITHPRPCAQIPIESS